MSGFCLPPVWCVAGRVVSVDVSNRAVEVCNAVVRVGQCIIQLTAWDQQISKLIKIMANEIYYFEALATRNTSSSTTGDNVFLKVTPLTTISACLERKC